MKFKFQDTYRRGSVHMLKKLYGKLESSINALESWMKERKNLVGLLVGIVILGGLIGCAVWLNQPVEGEVPTSCQPNGVRKGQRYSCFRGWCGPGL